MKQGSPFRVVLSEASSSPTEQLEYFALVNLGLAESLASGVFSATEAIQRFYHAANCLYIRKHLRSKEANAIMSHGVQLPDLFEFLPAEEAQREFSHELGAIRSLCLRLLENERAVSVKPRAARTHLPLRVHRPRRNPPRQRLRAEGPRGTIGRGDLEEPGGVEQ